MTETIPIYEKKLQIPSYFVDGDAKLTVSSLFSILQEMSDNHASLLGAGWHELRERGYFWVITKIQLVINRLPKWTETVLMRTWVKNSAAATSPRAGPSNHREGARNTKKCWGPPSMANFQE